jgi:hypothetical protein
MSAAALLVLAYAAVTSAPPKRTSTREAAIHAIDVRVILAGLPRRITVFFLVVPVGLAASTIVALGARAAAMRAGWAGADSTMIALAGMPLIWSVIASLQMTQSSLAKMAALAIGPAILGALLGLMA